MAFFPEDVCSWRHLQRNQIAGSQEQDDLDAGCNQIDETQSNVGCCEASVSDREAKVLEDEGKLLREAKEVVDNLLFSTKAQDDLLCYSWMVQISD